MSSLGKIIDPLGGPSPRGETLEERCTRYLRDGVPVRDIVKLRLIVSHLMEAHGFPKGALAHLRYVEDLELEDVELLLKHWGYTMRIHFNKEEA